MCFFFLGLFISKPTDCETAEEIEKFHVLALSRIEENLKESERVRERQIIRRPSIKVDNWDLIYTETNKSGFLGPVVNCCKNDQNAINTPKTDERCEKNNDNPCTEHKECLLADLPLDARKVTTLRRHYYPEGGWGWVIIVCTVMVHILNHGIQLSCSQMVFPGSEKFKIAPLHFAGKYVAINNPLAFTGKQPLFTFDVAALIEYFVG